MRFVRDEVVDCIPVQSKYERTVVEISDTAVNVGKFVPVEGEYCKKCSHRLDRVTGKGCPIGTAVITKEREPIYAMGNPSPIEFVSEGYKIEYICYFKPL